MHLCPRTCLLAVSAAAVTALSGCDGEDTLEPKSACGPLEAEGSWVRDSRSGLYWEAYVDSRQLTQVEAAARCASLGARLPTRKEVEALRLPRDSDPCQLPACAFRGARCGTIQCGTGVGPTELHWGVAMGSGALVGIAADQPAGSLCVRQASAE